MADRPSDDLLYPWDPELVPPEEGGPVPDIPLPGPPEEVSPVPDIPLPGPGDEITMAPEQVSGTDEAPMLMPPLAVGHSSDELLYPWDIDVEDQLVPPGTVPQSEMVAGSPDVEPGVGTDDNPMQFDPDPVTPLAAVWPQDEWTPEQEPASAPLSPDLEVPPELAEDVEGAQTNRLLAMSPEERAIDAERRSRARRDFVATRTAELRLKRRQEAHDNYTALLRGNAKVDRELADVDNELKLQAAKRIDNNQWMDTRSPGQLWAAYGSAILGGWMSPHYGGRNMGLEVLMKGIDDNIETQKFNLNQERITLGEKRNALEDIYSRNFDTWKASEIARLSYYDELEESILADAARFDPHGTAAQTHAELVLGIRAERTARLKEFEAELRNRSVDQEKMQLQRDRMLMEDRNAARQAKLDGWRISQGDKRLEAEMLKDGFRKTKKGWQFDEKLAKANKPMTMREQRIAQEIEAADNAKYLTDGQGQVLGQLREGPAGFKEGKGTVQAYEKFRTTGQRLLDILKDKGSTAFGGPGSERWQTEKKTQLNSLQTDLANQLAKIRDPESVNREGEVLLARNDIPTADGWTTSGNPFVKYDTVMKTADDAMDLYLEKTIVDFDETKSPVRRFQEIDKILMQDQTSRPREDVLKEAGLPLDPITNRDKTIRKTSIQARGDRFDELGDDEGITREEYTSLVKALDDELELGPENGGLSEDEYYELRGSLDANWIARSKSEDEGLDIPGPVKTYLAPVVPGGNAVMDFLDRDDDE